MGAIALPPEKRLVIAGREGNRRIVVAADEAAQAAGVRPGLALAQAQARVSDLHIEQADLQADRAALDRLGLWTLRRYSPVVAIDPPDGLIVDVTGCAHLFGGETAMLRDLLKRLNMAGIHASVALTDTIGAAHGLARYSGKTVCIAPAGETAKAIGSLPVAALRLDTTLADRLRRLGLDSIADLEATPRAPLALRFGSEPGRRLDQAFGRTAEPLRPICPPEFVHVRKAFAEPIGAPETLTRYITKLVESLCVEFERRGLGARSLDLLFQRVDGALESIRVGTAKPVRDSTRLTRLLTDRLETIDPGFGVEVMTLIASLAEPLTYRQSDGFKRDGASDVSALIDILANRIGADKIYRIAPAESDLPERSLRKIPPLAPPTGAVWPKDWPRPSRLMMPPEPVDTMALLPDHPPVNFTWRGVRRKIVRADGPERVFGEWWRRDVECDAVRDYFVVEDETGERFWLYRSGDGETPATGNMRWFIHGIFA